jgi:ribonuclease P protein subunit RPR2
MPSQSARLRHVLLVEDDEEDYEFTRDLFDEIRKPKHELIWVRDFHAAVAAAQRHAYDICLVDYRLDGAENGVDLARELIADGHKMPVILLTGTNDREVDNEAANIGAADFLVKGEVNAATLDRAIRYAIQNHAALRALQSSYRTTVRALAAVLELRDDATGAHASRVTELALRLARRVAPEIATEPELEYGFLLHDIGKIGVPDAILLKPGPLDRQERAHMERHVSLGQRLLAEIPFLNGFARQVAVAHHEHWDGTGYPNQLHGEEIPLPARIFAIVDAYDAMTNDRPYRGARTTEIALLQIELGAGTQFDPTLAHAFIAMINEDHAGSETKVNPSTATARTAAA